MGDVTVELDDEPPRGPEGIDREALDPDVHLRLREARGLAQLEETLFEDAEGQREARVVGGEGAAEGGAAGLAAPEHLL